MARTDLIADSLTVIRNASMIKKPTASIPASNLLEKMLEIFKAEGYIDNYKKMKTQGQGEIKVYLRFNDDQQPVITGLKRISKPSSRVYVKKDKVPYVLRGLGIALLSTSKGILSDKQARQEKVGGEVLCYIW